MGSQDQIKPRSRRLHVLGRSGSGHMHGLGEARLVHWHLNQDGCNREIKVSLTSTKQCTCYRRNRWPYEEPSCISHLYMYFKVLYKFHYVRESVGGGNVPHVMCTPRDHPYPHSSWPYRRPTCPNPNPQTPIPHQRVPNIIMDTSMKFHRRRTSIHARVSSCSWPCMSLKSVRFSSTPQDIHGIIHFQS